MLWHTNETTRSLKGIVLIRKERFKTIHKVISFIGRSRKATFQVHFEQRILYESNRVELCAYLQFHSWELEEMFLC